MNESLSEFETNLRAARPTGCDNLIAETFYRAGWEAHAVQLASPEAGCFKWNSSRAAALRTFGVGLLCGLLLTVSVSGVMSLVPANEDVSFCASTAAGNYGSVASLVVPTDVEKDSARSWGNPWTGFLSQIAIWNSFGPSNAGMERLPAERPLSLAARHYWSSLVAMDPGSWIADGRSNLEDSRDGGVQLRSSPFRAAMLEELL